MNKPYVVVSSSFSLKLKNASYWDRAKAEARAFKEASKTHGDGDYYRFPAKVWHHEDCVASFYPDSETGEVKSYTAEACGVRSLS